MTEDRFWRTRGVTTTNFGQLWKFEVAIHFAGSRFTIPDAVEEVLTAWCKVHCQHYWTRGSNRVYWFENEEDAILFNMAFCG